MIFYPWLSYSYAAFSIFFTKYRLYWSNMFCGNILLHYPIILKCRDVNDLSANIPSTLIFFLMFLKFNLIVFVSVSSVNKSFTLQQSFMSNYSNNFFSGYSLIYPSRSKLKSPTTTYFPPFCCPIFCKFYNCCYLHFE